MKQYWFLTVLALVLFTWSTAFGKDAEGKGAYVGIGATYAFEDFDLGSVSLGPDEGSYSPDFDDAWGLNLKLGYDFSPWFAMEFDFDYFSEFDMEDFGSASSFEEDLSPELQIETYMAVAKFSTGLEPVDMFFLVGAGFMSADFDVNGSAEAFDGVDIPLREGSEDDPCGKLGIGIDIHAHSNMSIGIEGAYVWGYGDLDEIRHVYVTVGVIGYFK